MTTDVRKNLPKGLNSVDMDCRGERRIPMANYGNAFELKTVDAILKAWGVTKKWLVNPTGLQKNNGTPDISTYGGPEYMLLYSDGKWRYAKFGGCNGPPWTYAPYTSYDAPNGETAYCLMILKQFESKLESVKQELKSTEAEVTKLRSDVQASTVKPQRSDELCK
jgi:hypothetical protein